MGDHNTIILSNSSYMEVPICENASLKADKKGIYYYKDSKDDINITGSSALSTDSGVNEMKKLKNGIVTGSEKINDGDVVVYLKDGIYSVFIKNTQYNDSLILQSTNKNLLIECWKTVNYHDPTKKPKFENASGSSGSGSGKVISAVEKTEKAVQSSASSKPTVSSSGSSSTSSSNWGYDFGSSSSGSSSKKSSSGGSVSKGSISGGSSSSDRFSF